MLTALSLRDLSQRAFASCGRSSVRIARSEARMQSTALPCESRFLRSSGEIATSSWRTPPFAMLTALSLLPDRSTSAAPRFSGQNRNVLSEDSSARNTRCAVASAGQINFGCASFLWAEPQRPLRGLLRSQCSLRCRFLRTNRAFCALREKSQPYHVIKTKV